MSSNTKAFEDKMKSAVEHLERELKTVRAGRANPGVLDKVTVDYYGSPTPIQQVASVAVSEARTLTITPWDRTLLRAISKAILASDVGINPIDDGQTIRLNFPAPTEERRKQLAKEVSKMGEEAKVAVRNVRRDAMDKAKAMKKAGELTEDTQKTMEEDVQKLTDKYVKNIDAAVEEKQKEIMSVPCAERRCAALFARRDVEEEEHGAFKGFCEGTVHRHHHGRQRPLGQEPRPAPHRRP
jgi:ribosome recycling factor